MRSSSSSATLGALEGVEEARQVGEDDVGVEVDPPVGGEQPLGQSRAQRAEVEAARTGGAELAHRQARPAGAQQEVELAGRRGAQPRLGLQGAAVEAGPGGGDAAGARAPRPLAQDGEPEVAGDLPVVPTAGVLGQERRAEPRGVADREEVEDEVVVVALERPGRREDDVGVARRLVEVEVDGDHRVELGDRRVEAVTAGGRRHRVARDGQQRPDPAGPGGGHVLGEGGDGELAPEPGQPADARAPAGEPTRAEDAAPDEVDGGRREHRAAGSVEVAGEEVERLDRPLAEHAERLRRHPHPAVDGGRGRRGEVAREPADVIGAAPR